MTDDARTAVRDAPDPSSSSEAGSSPPAHGRRTGAGRSDRHAVKVFIAAEIAALPVLLFLGRDRWFRYDEWDFLAARRAGSLHDLFAPHNVHWSTLPVLVYRALWTVFGLHSYLPYQLTSVVAHLVVVALVWTLARRAGVRPWTATALAVLALFLGSGEENILWAFGMTFVATMAFGLAQLLLADHDGPIDRRDVLGLGAGVLALMCSGVAVTMVIVVGLATLARRGWKAAAFHTVPLAAVYGLWFLLIGHEYFQKDRSSTSGSLFAFVRTAGAAAFGRVAQVPGLGWFVAALLVVGCTLAWRGRPLDELRRTVSAPAAMFAGALIFLMITGLGRGTGVATATRYTYITVMLAIPVIGIAADAVMRRLRPAAPILVVLLAVAIVGNVGEFNNAAQRRWATFQKAYREQLFLTPRLPIASRLPPLFRPDTALAPAVTIQWLLDGVAAGRIPRPDPITPTVAATRELALTLRHVHVHATHDCESVSAGTRLHLARGGSFKLSAPVVLRYIRKSGVQSSPVEFAPNLYGSSLVAYAGPLDVKVVSAGPAGTVNACDVQRGAPIEGFPVARAGRGSG